MRPSFTLNSRNKTLSLGKRTAIMGIVNVTPDSFYEESRNSEPSRAVALALNLVEQGADLIDIGGQSTRPGATPIGAEEELRRVLPVLQAIRKQSDIWISVDTYRSKVAQRCIEEGADMINDVSSFREDPEMASVLGKFKVPVVCMHYLQSIHPMPANPEYSNLLLEIKEFFRDTLTTAKNHGITHVLLDPGIGFGKKLEHNLEIIRQLSFLQEFGLPILAGPSRKSFIGKITGQAAEDRLEGTAAAAAVCIQQGAHILRVHDVQFFRRFCDVLDKILNPKGPESAKSG